MKKTLEIPQTLFRGGTAAFDKETGVVRLSFSSDAPVLRRTRGGDQYYEILDHSERGMNKTRLRAGTSLLFNHNPEILIGRNTFIGVENGRGYVDSKISRAEDVKSYATKIEEGILCDSSVGYGLEDDGEEIGERDGIPEVRFRWIPSEVSLVTIPADISVGVGRDESNLVFRSISISNEKVLDDKKILSKKGPVAATTPKNMAIEAPETPVTTPAPPTPPATRSVITVDEGAIRSETLKTERKRIAEIQDLEKHICEKGVFGRKVDPTALTAISARMISEGKRVEDFQGELMRAELPELKPITTSPEIGASKRGLKDYSLVRAINGALGQFNRKKWDGLEREMHDATVKQLGRESNGGFFVPHDVMSYRGLEQRALATNLFTGAGAFVQVGPQGQSMIELYRNQMKVVKMGARTLTGLVGNLAIPAQTGGATAYWLPENGTITATDQTVGQVALTPQRLGAATAFTLQLLAQTDNPDIESFVREDLMKVLALAKDKAALVGAGSAGEPLGIYNVSGLSTSVTLANAGTMTYAEALRFELNVANNNADVGQLGYLTTPTVRAGTKTVAEISAANSLPVWRNNMVNGYPADATLQITSAGTVYFGNWNDLILADWAGQEIIVDPYSLSMQGQVRIVMQQLTSVALRHAKSFSVSTN